MDEHTIARFWRHVERGVNLDDCWLWNGPTWNTGYGMVYVQRTRPRIRMRAHRVSWEIANGPIPDGLCVCHACDNPPCCNPRHLWLGTKSENTRDMFTKGRQARGERSGPRKHRERMPRGENHWQSKLTDDLVRQIRREYAAGLTQKELAARCGVNQTTIGNVVLRKTWFHVE